MTRRSDGAAGQPQRAVVTGFRERHVHGRTAIPHPGRDRRLHARVPSAGYLYLAVRRPSRLDTGCSNPVEQQADHGRQ
mgnify:CR=1 FL=1